MADAQSRNLAVCFFGVTRSLTHTIDSIEKNVLAPARRLATLRICSHFFLQHEIDNPRSGEKGSVATEEHLLLDSDWLRLEQPEDCLDRWGFADLKVYGDVWHDNYKSLRNLIHQLHSLDVVTEAALDGGAEICIFCRPDLRYHDSLAQPIKRALLSEKNAVYLPGWQSWAGLNDRFAVVAGRPAISAYGQRIRAAKRYCQDTMKPLHAERLLEYSLTQQGIAAEKIKTRASRIRIDGSTSTQDMFRPWIWRFGAALTDRLGINSVFQRLWKRGRRRGGR